MRELNISNHKLGSHGYDRKEPKRQEEDAGYIAVGIENPWDKYPS
jgi:hypothetical protein